MKFEADKEEKFTVFMLNETNLSSQIAPLLKSEMILLNAEGIRNIIFNMEKITFVDSSGLSAILITNRLCTNANGTFVIANAGDSVMRLIKISQLDSILKIVPTVQEAKDLVMMEELERDLKGEDEGE